MVCNGAEFRRATDNRRAMRDAQADRGDVERQDEDDEEAEVPGQQRSKQDHPLLLPEVSVAMQQEECQEEHHHHLHAQRRPAHPDAPGLRPRLHR